jgi:hypothetical protein
MNMPVVRRAPDGKLLAGSCLNPGGRPKAAIEEVREILGRHKEELVATLLQLMKSDDEGIRLAAVKEAFDRVLGRAVQSMDTTSTRTTLVEHSIQQLYLSAVREVNRQPDPRAPVDVTPVPDAGNGAIEW